MFQKENIALLKNSSRNVSWSVVIKAFFGQPTSLLGWLFLTMGMVVLIFIKTVNFGSLLFLFKPFTTTNAVITEVVNTGITAGSKGTSNRIYKIVYEFADQAQKYSGSDYYEGEGMKVQALVKINYLNENKALTKLDGAIHWSQFIVLIFFAFPLIGLIVIILNLKKGWFYINMLKNGQLAYGEIGSKVPTGVYINKVAEYKVEFAFKAGDSRIYKFFTKTLKPEDLEDDTQEALLYNPVKPDEAMLLDDFPGSIYVDGGSVIRMEQATGLVMLYLLQPILFVWAAIIIAKFI